MSAIVNDIHYINCIKLTRKVLTRPLIIAVMKYAIPNSVAFSSKNSGLKKRVREYL